MTNELNQALSDAMKQVRRLKKADNNAFAKYKYTSVDDFKDTLRPILAELGLSISVDEVSCKMVQTVNDKEKKTNNLKFKFAIRLEHQSGEKGRKERLTVMLPYVGAQTSGAARSYAVKEYLKSRFLASSGDSEDADRHDENITLSKQESRPLYKELQEELNNAIQQDRNAMEAWALRRKPSINILPNDWQLMLRRTYQEALATGKVSPVAVFESHTFEDVKTAYEICLDDATLSESIKFFATDVEEMDEGHRDALTEIVSKMSTRFHNVGSK